MSKLYRFLLVSLAIVLLVSACGGDDKDKESSDTSSTAKATATAEPQQPEEATKPPAPTEAPQATTPPQPPATATAEPAPKQPTEAPAQPTTPAEVGGKLGELLRLDSVETDPREFSGEALQSYRLRAGWRIEPKEGSTATAEAYEIEAARTSDPLAEEMHMSIESQGISASYIHIGDRFWFQSGDQWIEMSSSELGEFDQMFYGLDSATAGLSGDAKLVGQEDLNGVATYHYSFDETILGAGAGVYSSIRGEVWVAVEGEYVVKYDYAAEDSEATYSWAWEVYDINAPFTIEPPAGAQGAREDIPIMSDATEQVTVGGMITYKTPSDLSTVLSFYKEQMPANGWTLNETTTMVTPQFALLYFDKDGETASVTLAPDDAGGTGVVIQAGE